MVCGGGFGDWVLALGVGDAPRGDLGPTESGPSGGMGSGRPILWERWGGDLGGAWFSEEFYGFKKTVREALHAEVDGGQKAVRHENKISAMGIGNGEAINRIQVGELAVGVKGLPAVANKKIPDLVFVGDRSAGDGGLLDKKAKTCGGLVNSEEPQLVCKKKIMPLPALQVIDGRGARVFIGPVHDLEPEKSGPCGFEEGAGGFAEPDLVFVALIGGGQG